MSMDLAEKTGNRRYEKEESRKRRQELTRITDRKSMTTTTLLAAEESERASQLQTSQYSCESASLLFASLSIPTCCWAISTE